MKIGSSSLMRILLRGSLSRGCSSNRNNNDVILVDIQKRNQVESRDRVIFRNCSDTMFPFATHV